MQWRYCEFVIHPTALPSLTLFPLARAASSSPHGSHGPRSGFIFIFRTGKETSERRKGARAAAAPPPRPSPRVGRATPRRQSPTGSRGVRERRARARARSPVHRVRGRRAGRRAPSVSQSVVIEKMIPKPEFDLV